MNIYTKKPVIVDEAIKHCDSFQTVIQAGAHVGVWPHRLANEFHLVVAYEPKYESWDLASEKTKDLANVMLINGALGAKRTHSKIRGKPFGGSSKIDPINGDFTPVYTIDSLPWAIRSRIDAIFLDVEGYELEVLKGAANVLSSRLPLLVLEYEEFWTREELRAVIPQQYEEIGVFHRDMILKAR